MLPDTLLLFVCLSMNYRKSFQACYTYRTLLTVIGQNCFVSKFAVGPTSCYNPPPCRKFKYCFFNFTLFISLFTSPICLMRTIFWGVRGVPTIFPHIQVLAFLHGSLSPGNVMVFSDWICKFIGYLAPCEIAPRGIPQHQLELFNIEFIE